MRENKENANKDLLESMQAKEKDGTYPPTDLRERLPSVGNFGVRQHGVLAGHHRHLHPSIFNLNLQKSERLEYLFANSRTVMHSTHNNEDTALLTEISAVPKRIHVNRTVSRHCDYRDSCRDVITGFEQGEEQGPEHSVHEQWETVNTSVETLFLGLQ
jgi:hypothetical protein